MGGEGCSTPHPGRFTSGKRLGDHYRGSWITSIAGLEGYIEEKVPQCHRFMSRNVYPVESRCTVFFPGITHFINGSEFLA